MPQNVSRQAWRLDRPLALVCAFLLVDCSSNQSSRSTLPREPQTSEAFSNGTTAVKGGDASKVGDASPETSPYTIVTAHHVMFHERSGLNLKAEWLEGRLYPTRSGVIPTLDDASSFLVEIEEGKMSMTTDELCSILVTRVLTGSRLSDVRLSPRGPHEIQINAILHKLVPLPVQLTGDIGATPDGRIRIDIRSVKVMKMPVKGLLHSLRIQPADLTNVKNSAAVQVDGDSIYLRTEQLLPPPRKLGKVTDVHFTADDRLEEDYGAHSQELPSPDNWKPGKWSNFMRLSGGTIRFGKLTMDNTDLVLIDASRGEWFDFDLSRYQDQMVKGQMHMTPRGGLQVFLPGTLEGR